MAVNYYTILSAFCFLLNKYIWIFMFILPLITLNSLNHFELIIDFFFDKKLFQWTINVRFFIDNNNNNNNNYCYNNSIYISRVWFDLKMAIWRVVWRNSRLFTSCGCDGMNRAFVLHLMFTSSGTECHHWLSVWRSVSSSAIHRFVRPTECRWPFQPTTGQLTYWWPLSSPIPLPIFPF